MIWRILFAKSPNYHLAKTEHFTTATLHLNIQSLPAKIDNLKRDDIAINVTGIFESIYIEVNSDNLKAVVGEIYRVPNTNEVNSINMYSQIISKLQNYTNDIIIGTDQNLTT